MNENIYIEEEDISFEELEFIRTLSHLECIDDCFILDDEEI